MSEFAQLTREELNVRAEAAGVDNPSGLANKQAVIDAILAAGGAAGPRSATANAALRGRGERRRIPSHRLRQRRARGRHI
ncbi:MAG TPA: hypothetical protein VH834_18005 [Solirubrobacteraceae bacterium]|jgi:hypothetical protein